MAQAYARSDGDGGLGSAPIDVHSRGRVHQVDAVVRTRDPQTAAQVSRTAQKRLGRQAIAPAGHNRRDALLHGGGTEEHCSRNAVHLGDHVRAVVHPVGEVHVQMRGWSEHHP